MKRMLRFFILNILFLFVALPFSYAKPAPVMDNAENVFQEEGPSPMMSPSHCPMEPMKGMPDFRPPSLMHMEFLKLSEKQKEAIKEIENSVAKELIRKKADEQIAGIELRELLDKETVDLKAVGTKLKQIGDIKTDAQLIVFKSMEDMKAKLTAEQRAMLKKMRPMEHRMKPMRMQKDNVMRNDEILPPPSMEEKGEN